MLGSQASNLEGPTAGRTDININCAFERFFIQVRCNEQKLHGPAIDHVARVNALAISHTSQRLLNRGEQNPAGLALFEVRN